MAVFSIPSFIAIASAVLNPIPRMSRASRYGFFVITSTASGAINPEYPHRPHKTLPAFLRRKRFLDMTAGIVAWPSAEDLPPFRALEWAVLDTALARN